LVFRIAPTYFHGHTLAFFTICTQTLFQVEPSSFNFHHMLTLFKTKLGRIRIIGFLEGLSLLVLIFVAIPMKHLFHNPALSKFLGPIHGAIFLVFVLNTMSLAIEQNWKFRTTTWKIIVACFIPFGTFYIDHKIFKNLKES
jgi:integral membrane protein